MEQNPLCIAFASQKGGVGKSTLTVLAASWLYYLHGIRVAVVDCDYPQHSILKLSNRDKAVVQSSAIYGRLLVSLAENKGVKPYRILCCKPSEAMSEWRKWAAVAEERYDVVLFDLPGTVGNEGVLSTIVELDYLFIPMKADRIVLESTLNFASVLNDRLIKTGRAHLRELFLSKESFYTFLEQGLCLFNEETNYRSSLSPFGIKMADRVSGIPIHLDISDYPMKKGWISNRNRVVIGPSGGGKSFILNHICRQYYEQGAHIVIVDTGNSYQGLCSLIRQKTKGRDGIYFTYQEDAPVAFNPFFVEDGVYDVEKRESLKALLLTLWKRESEEPTRAEEVALSNAVNLYLSQLKTGTAVTPSFNTFYEFVATDYRRLLEKKRVREKDFDIENFLNVLEPYYRGGEYDYLLNSDKQLDLLDKRFIVFELDNISENKVLYPVITLIIMETFLTKMRRLKGIRKVLLLEEAWKAIAKAGMAGFIKYLCAPVQAA